MMPLLRKLRESPLPLRQVGSGSSVTGRLGSGKIDPIVAKQCVAFFRGHDSESRSNQVVTC